MIARPGVERRAGFCGLVRFQINIGDVRVGLTESALPFRVTGIRLGEAVADGEAVGIGLRAAARSPWATWASPTFS